MTIEQQTDYLRDFLMPLSTPTLEPEHLPPSLSHLSVNQIKDYINQYVEANGRAPERKELIDFMVQRVGEIVFEEDVEAVPPTSDGSLFEKDEIINSTNMPFLAGMIALMGLVTYLRRNRSSSQKYTRFNI